MNNFVTFFLFLMLAPLVEYIFLATFYGLYFNRQFFKLCVHEPLQQRDVVEQHYFNYRHLYTLHNTIYQVLTVSCRPLWAAFMYCFKDLLFDLWLLLQAVFLVIFIEKFSPLLKFEPTTSVVPV